MYYLIEYEYDGRKYKVTVLPHENPMFRLMSLTDSGAKIIDILEYRS